MNDKTATRRGFFLKAGAAAAVPAALALGVPDNPASAASSARLEARLAVLEDSNALRRLTGEFVGLVNDGKDADKLLRATVAEIDAQDFDQHATVNVSADRHHAEIQVPCTVAVDVPIEAPDSVLIDMAQLQGEGSLRRLRTQMLILSCARTASGWTVTRARLEDAS